MQTAIPYLQFRGGTSKGLYFLDSDLPKDQELRDNVLLSCMEGVGNGDPRQIDGMGGGHSLTSKVAIIKLSESPGIDLEYLFLQVVVGEGKVRSDQTCGNILAGVLPFALETGLLRASIPRTKAKIKIMNTGGLCEMEVETPNGEVNYVGEVKVDGVPGTASPILCYYLDIAGSTCGALFPTGNRLDQCQGIEITCIDNGMPEILLRAGDLGITGYESPEELNKNEGLKSKLESIRKEMGPKMNLGEVTDLTIPKLCLISKPRKGGILNTRTFIPKVCHEAIGVLGAVSTATACIFPGTLAHNFIMIEQINPNLSIEHPTGEFTVNLEWEESDGDIHIIKSGLVRTARLISKGNVYIPRNIWLGPVMD